MNNKGIRFIVRAVLWRDKVNGNTYHSVRIIRCSDKAVITGQFQYGYGDQYRHTALLKMAESNWLGACDSNTVYRYERENGYPIYWEEIWGTKKECLYNGLINIPQIYGE